jgi:hypothetical protein
VVDVVEVDEVDEVVDVDVDVEAAVVTGVVVLVTTDGSDVDEVPPTDEEVEPESVVAGSSLLHPAIDSAMTKGTKRVGFTVGSLARFVTIT